MQTSAVRKGTGVWLGQQALFQLQRVKPEHVTAYEIGAKTSFFDRHLIVNGAAFHNDDSDEQVFAAVQVGAFIHNLTGTKYFLTSTDLTSPFGVLTPVVGPPQTFGFDVSDSY